MATALCPPKARSTNRRPGPSRRRRPPTPSPRNHGARCPPISAPQRREVRINYEPPAEPAKLDASPVRQIVGLPAPDTPRHDPAAPAPDSLRELAYLDRINEIGDADCLDGAAKLPRLYDVDYTILALLDRAGLLPRSLIAEASMPGRSSNAVIDRLTKLYRHGLIAQHPTGLREHASTDGRPPRLYSLTRRGLAGRPTAPAASDLHAPRMATDRRRPGPAARA